MQCRTLRSSQPIIVIASVSKTQGLLVEGYGQYGTWTIRYGHFGADISVRGYFGTGQIGTWTFRYVYYVI